MRSRRHPSRFFAFLIIVLSGGYGASAQPVDSCSAIFQRAESGRAEGSKPRDQLALLTSRQIVTGLESRFEELFRASPYGSFDAFERALRSSTDPLIQKAIHLIDHDQIEVVIRQPRRVRDGIASFGLLNQNETKVSSMDYEPELRNVAEANLLNIPVIDYLQTDDRVKPKYGYLRAKRGSGVVSKVVKSILRLPGKTDPV